MDYDGPVCLKGPQLMDLESHYSDPPPLCSLFCACLHELYGCFHQRARLLFECLFFFSFVFRLFGSKKKEAGRCCCKCHAYCSCALQLSVCLSFVSSCLSVKIPWYHEQWPSLCVLWLVVSGAYRRADSETVFEKHGCALGFFWDVSFDSTFAQIEYLLQGRCRFSSRPH